MRVLQLVIAGSLALTLVACGSSAASSGDGRSGDVTGSDAGPSDSLVDATDPGGDGQTNVPGGDVSGLAAAPCSLFSIADVEQASGTPGMETEEIANPGASLCSYRPADTGIEITIGIAEGETATGQFQTLAFLKDSGVEGLERIDGIGDDAIYSGDDTTLFMLKGTTGVNIFVRDDSLDAPANRDLALTLGRLANDRL